jgi:TonB family protein
MERRAMKPWTIMVAALLGWTSGAHSQAPTPAPKPADSKRAAMTAADSLTASLVGTWTAGHGTKVMINPSDVGVLSIRYVGRFLATGFYDGRGFVGITRSPEYPNGGPMRIGSLRFQAPVGGTIAAELADDASAASTRRELWTRLASETKPPAGSPNQVPQNIVVAPPSGEETPKFGDYVYVEELPEAIAKVDPRYPEVAKQKGIEGTVMIQALVAKDGTVTDTRVVKSIPELDDAAIAAVRQWRFKPAMTKGQPVAVWVAVPVAFKATATR